MTANIANSTVTGNSAHQGAGIGNGGSLTVTNSTISDNTIRAGGGSGEAISNAGTAATATITNSTLSNRSNGTALIFTYEGSSAIHLRGTILSSSSGSNCGGPVATLGANVANDTSCFANVGTDQVVADVGLGPLADNGGPTKTHALLAGSPAIDRGSNANCSTADQRGLPRPRDGDGDGSLICDAGAYEVQTPHLVISGFVINAGQATTSSKAVTLTFAASGAGTEMSFSNTNNESDWSPWEPVATTRAWALASGADGPRTVYVQVRDGIGHISPTASDTIVYETTAPTISSLVVNNGALATTSTAVNLALQASDAGGSALTQMSFSNDGGATWSAWEAFAAAKAWTLTSGNGPKTVHARVRDGAGNVSSPISKAITLDTAAGTSYGISINQAAVWTNTAAVNLTISAAPGTSKMMISNDGGFFGAAWEPFNTRKTWTLNGFGAPVTMFAYVRFADANGTELWASSRFDDIVLDTSPPTGSVAVGGGAAAATVDQGNGQAVVRTVQLTASDTQSGAVMQMRLSNRADFAGAIWKPFASSVSWDFTGGGTVYAQFKDGAGNLSQPYSQTVPGIVGPGTSPTPPSCSPRPRVVVNLQKANGTLLATLATTGANNGIRAVRFDTFTTAIVDVGDQLNQNVPFAVSIPAGQEPTSLQFTIRRQPGAASATVRLVVIDGCGEWSTLLGGGPKAWIP